MGRAEAIRGLHRAAWPGESGLKNARPKAESGKPGPGNPSQARTPAEALSYIESLYKSGRMEDLGKLLRKSQVFRAAWLIVQQSSSDLAGAAGKGDGSLYLGKSERAASLPVPASGPPGLTIAPKPGAPEARGPGAADPEPASPVPAAGRVSSAGVHDAFASRSQAAHPLSLLLQAYQNQEDYRAWERRRGLLINIRA